MKTAKYSMKRYTAFYNKQKKGFFNMANYISETQQDMEKWMEKSFGTNSKLYTKGIIAQLNPSFICCDFENNSLTLEFTAEPWAANPEGILHGGILVTAFDTTFGALCHYYAKQNMINTVEISTSFLKPVPLNSKYQITAKANHVGRTLTSMTAEARLVQSNTLLATASTTFIKLHKEFSQKLP